MLVNPMNIEIIGNDITRPFPWDHSVPISNGKGAASANSTNEGASKHSQGVYDQVKLRLSVND